MAVKCSSNIGEPMTPSRSMSLHYLPKDNMNYLILKIDKFLLQSKSNSSKLCFKKFKILCSLKPIRRQSIMNTRTWRICLKPWLLQMFSPSKTFTVCSKCTEKEKLTRKSTKLERELNYHAVLMISWTFSSRMVLKKLNNSKYTIHQKDPKREMIQWRNASQLPESPKQT